MVKDTNFQIQVLLFTPHFNSKFFKRPARPRDPPGFARVLKFTGLSKTRPFKALDPGPTVRAGLGFATLQFRLTQLKERVRVQEQHIKGEKKNMQSRPAFIECKKEKKGVVEPVS